MNTVIVILLAVFVAFCNATQDEIRFHWSRFFGKILKPGSKIELWMNPSKSWEIKWLGKSRLVDLIMSTAFVWLTDLWHLLKALIINSLFVICLLLIGVHWSLWEWLVALLLLNITWGGVFELFFAGIYGALSDKVNNKHDI